MLEALARAIPKSPSLISPVREMKTLEGETSQWMIPQLVAARAGRLVRVPQRVQDGLGQVHREVHRERDAAHPAAADDLAEVAPVDQLHRHVIDALELPHLQHLDDVGVVQEAGEVRLAGEGVHVLGVQRQVLREPLDRHRPPGARPGDHPRAVHLRHPAAPQQGEDLVVAEAVWGRGLRGHGGRPYFGWPLPRCRSLRLQAVSTTFLNSGSSRSVARSRSVASSVGSANPSATACWSDLMAEALSPCRT